MTDKPSETTIHGVILQFIHMNVNSRFYNKRVFI